MSFPKVPISIIIICLIFAILGGLWGAQTAGLNVQGFLGKLPFIAEPEEVSETLISPLEQENIELQKAIELLEGQLAEVKQEVRTQRTEIDKLLKENENLESEKEQLKAVDENFTQLVSYYQEMKPKDIIPIFENLDDEMVLRVILELDSNLVSKVLAGMEPSRAAKLTKSLTDNR